MSVLSALAEHAELASALTHPLVGEAAAQVVGKFKVVRTELGSTTMDFREFVCSQLEEALAGWNITYRFPHACSRRLLSGKSRFVRTLPRSQNSTAR